MAKKIFAVLQHQEDSVHEYCFGLCGKVIVGMLGDDLLGACFPCREEDCPYEEERMEYGTNGDDVVWLRKLKEPQQKASD